jgi:hypothetical protein
MARRMEVLTCMRRESSHDDVISSLWGQDHADLALTLLSHLFCK